MKKTLSFFAVLFLAASAAQAQNTPRVDPAKVEGNITTGGSSTVAPLSIAIVERFRGHGYRGLISVDSIGTGAGFSRWGVTGDIDIANASRTIRASETDSARRIGRTPIGFHIATDALAICVAETNTFVDNMTTEEIAQAFSTAVFWSDIRPTWPRQRILKFSPGTDSGTFDYFVEHFHARNRQRILQSDNIQFSENDNVLVRGIQRSRYAIGYFGFAFFQNARGLRAVKVDDVTPSAETVAAKTYSVARPLFIYADANTMRSKPQVAAFLVYYFDNVDEVVRRVGYFPVSDAVMAQNRQLWLGAMGNTPTPWAR